jgi:hypothetical protein
LVIFGLGELILAAFRVHWAYGIANLVTIPVGPLVFGLTRYKSMGRALCCVVVGLFLGAAPFAYQHAHEFAFGLGERDRVLNGERHLVLTGWDRPDYEILKKKLDVVVLELGNKDVTDATLDALRQMPKLRELTLNDSSITDAGLSVLAELKELKSLRMARTQVTREGIEKFLANPPPQLQQLDVSGLEIPSSLLRPWKNQDPEHRQYVN